MSVKKRKKPDPIAAMDRKIAKIVRSVELIEQRTDDMQESMYHIIDQLNMDHVIREPLSIDKLNQMCARVGDLWYRIIKRGGKGPTDVVDLMGRLDSMLRLLESWNLTNPADPADKRPH